MIMIVYYATKCDKEKSRIGELYLKTQNPINNQRNDNIIHVARLGLIKQLMKRYGKAKFW